MDPIRRELAVEALYSAGYALYTNERAKEALDVFRMLLLAVPGDERGWLGLGACHEALGQTDIAVRLYRRAPFATGASARIELAVARGYRALGDLEEMNSAFERACELALASESDDLYRTIERERGAL